MSNPTKETVGASVGDSVLASEPGTILHASDAKLPRSPSPQLEPAVEQDHDLNDSSHGHVSSAAVPSLSAPVAQEEIEAVEVS
jgi:hypothetical protein